MEFEFTGSPKDANAVGIEASVLHVAVQQGNAHHVRVLLEHGADPNKSGEMGYTPLHDAVFYGNQIIADLLMENGARADIKNEFGQTPLAMAQQSGAKALAKIIKRR